jgi:DNA-binding response OmpR family regulator
MRCLLTANPARTGKASRSPAGELRPGVETVFQIMLVEDDPATAGLLVDLLQAEGHQVWHALDAKGARNLLNGIVPDLFILDVVLPDESGLLLCSALRARTDAPILLLSASRRQDDAEIGRRLGANDFIAKPVAGHELVARVAAALRRVAATRQPGAPPRRGPQRIGRLTVDQARCEVTLDGRLLSLTPTEYRLLCILASRPRAVHSRQEMGEQIWGYHDAGVARSLEVHLSGLRRKLETGSSPRPAIVAVRGIGYRLSPSLIGAEGS